MSAVDYISKREFVWWQGFVEDVHDPMRLGRVRVRIVGWHNPDKADMPVEDLPWALPLMPLTSSSTTGIGASPTGLVPGAVVIGFFRDGALAQQPIVFGTVPGIPTEGPPGGSYGFGDPRLTVATAGYYMPKESELGETGERGRYAPRSGHYVGETFAPGESLFGEGNLDTVGGIAKYEYDFYSKGVTHKNSRYGNIYPRFWNGPTGAQGSIAPLSDVNTLAGGCGPTHGSQILQDYIIDRGGLGVVLPVPKFRPYYEIPLVGYNIADLVAQSGNPADFSEEGVKKFDLGAGGGFRTGADIYGKIGGLPPQSSGASAADLLPDGASPLLYGFETTTSMRGNEYFERMFGITENYLVTKKDESGKEYLSYDENSPWLFFPPKGTTHTRIYPYNHVYESESGHIMEFDDTNGGERVKIAHRLGTSEEIIEDGSKIEQVVNDKYTRILGDNNTVVGGNSIFFGERGFRAIVNAEALLYSTEVSEGRPTGVGTTADDDPFVYGPGFIGTGERGGPGWWTEDTMLPDGKKLGESQFFTDPAREKEIFEGNYPISLPEGIDLTEGVKFYSGYRGLPRSNFFKGGNTDIIIAYGNLNIHLMQGNANLRLDQGDMNVELLKGDMKSYIGGNHFQRVDGSVVRFVGGNVYDVVQGKRTTITQNEDVQPRLGINILNNGVDLSFTLNTLGGGDGSSPAATPGPVQGSQNPGSPQEERGGSPNFGSGQGNIIGGL
jgi:hypothetical protein